MGVGAVWPAGLVIVSAYFAGMVGVGMAAEFLAGLGGIRVGDTMPERSTRRLLAASGRIFPSIRTGTARQSYR